MNQEINDRIRIIVHRLWWLAKIAADRNIITAEMTFVVGGLRAGKRYAFRIMNAMRILEMELFRIQIQPPIPRFPPGAEHPGGLAMVGDTGEEMIQFPRGEQVYGPSFLPKAMKVVNSMNMAMDARKMFESRWAQYTKDPSIIPVIKDHAIPSFKFQVDESLADKLRFLEEPGIFVIDDFNNLFALNREAVAAMERGKEKPMTNVELHQLSVYNGIECHLCHRTYPTTVLNIEAMIHHNAKAYTCVDTKDCRRARRKTKH